MVRLGCKVLPHLNALAYHAKALLNPKKFYIIGHSWALNSEQGILSSGNVEYKLDQQIQEGDIIVRLLYIIPGACTINLFTVVIN